MGKENSIEQEIITLAIEYMDELKQFVSYDWESEEAQNIADEASMSVEEFRKTTLLMSHTKVKAITRLATTGDSSLSHNGKCKLVAIGEDADHLLNETNKQANG